MIDSTLTEQKAAALFLFSSIETRLFADERALPTLNGIKDLSLVYFLNTKANIVVKSPFGETNPFICSSIVKQGTVFRTCSQQLFP